MAQRKKKSVSAGGSVPKAWVPAIHYPPEKVPSFLGDRIGKEGLKDLTGLPEDELAEIMKRMMLIREFDTRCVTLYRAGKFRGVTHPYVGMEAMAVGTISNLRKEDYITSTHRGHGHVLAKGGDPGRCMAELMGRATGYCKGRGGTLHLADMSRGILGANGIVGGGLGIGIGSALASQMLRRPTVTVSFFGDGALNEGILHETSNMAAIWKLPIVFLCENNIYSMSGIVDQMVALKDGSFLSRSNAFGIPGLECDGNNVIDVLGATREAIDRARRGEGPTYVFCHSYRVLGHHVGDPLDYRDKSECELWKYRDPITVYAAILKNDGLATDEDIESWSMWAKTSIDEAVAFAEASPVPDPRSVMEDVFDE